mmetsp:Transcript_23365/g.26785  ORF Transcript_23365/g.26785 Transcript_23365/m.26785 type:complete len:86 (-) Transcript_23365:360-617(-)
MTMVEMSTFSNTSLKIIVPPYQSPPDVFHKNKDLKPLQIPFLKLVENVETDTKQPVAKPNNSFLSKLYQKKTTGSDGNSNIQKQK